MLAVRVFICMVVGALVPTFEAAIYSGVMNGNFVNPYFKQYQLQNSNFPSYQQPYGVYNSPLMQPQLSEPGPLFFPNGYYPDQGLNQNNLQPHNPMDDFYLRESAKDPRNLRNGVYQQGAVTYDLGAPHYEILNPHDEPEIITSDQPQYHQHLNELQQSQNYTLEDFGVTAATPATPTTTESIVNPTTYYRGEADDAEGENTTTEASLSLSGPSKDLKIMQQSIEKELSRTKEKLELLSEQIKTKCQKNKIYTSRTKGEEVSFVVSRKKGKQQTKPHPAAFRPVTPHTPQKCVENEKYKTTAQKNAAGKSKTYNFYTEHAEHKPTYSGSVQYPNSDSSPETSSQFKEANASDRDLHSANSLYLQEQNENMKFPYDSPVEANRNAYSERSKYPEASIFPPAQNPFNEMYKDDPPQFGLNNIQRLYRSASVLTATPKAKEKKTEVETTPPAAS